MAPAEERNWTVFHNQADVGLALSDLTAEEQTLHVPVLLTVPFGLREMRLAEIEEPLEEVLSQRALGFFAGHTQKLNGDPPQLSLFLVRKDLLSPGMEAIRTWLKQSGRYAQTQVEVLDKFPEWADPESLRLAGDLHQLGESRSASLGRVPARGCLGGLFGPKEVLVDVWFSEAWDYEGQKSPAFEAIERRLIPAIESRMIGEHEGEGSFVGTTEYNIGFAIKKKFVPAAIDVLSKELRDMGAPRSTRIEANGQEYPVY